jgi:hypothetical protein
MARTRQRRRRGGLLQTLRNTLRNTFQGIKNAIFTDDPNCHHKRTLYNKCRRGSWYTNRCSSDWQALEKCNREHKDEHYERFLRKKLGEQRITLSDENDVRSTIAYFKMKGYHETARDLQSFLNVSERNKRRGIEEMRNHRDSFSPT